MSVARRITSPKPRAARRKFSAEEKLQIVREAYLEDGVVVADVAIQYGLKPSQIYLCRKQFDHALTEGRNVIAEPGSTERDRILKSQREIASLESEIVKPLRCRLVADLRDGKLSSYSCTIALSSLVTSICKLNEEKRILDERLAELPVPQSHQVSKLSLEQRWAEVHCHRQ